MTVDLAVVPAAGKGTRMRPATRVVPKALLPVVDRPAVQYAVEESARAGAREVVVIVDPGVGELVHRHFTEEGALPGLEDVVVRPVVQDEPRGLGHAVWTARQAVGDRSFFCLLVDNIVQPGRDVLTGMLQATDGRSVVCLRTLTDELLARYGVIVPGEWHADRVVEVTGAVEKPGVAGAPSRLGLVGRYLFTPDIFPILENTEPGYGGEIQLTDAIARLASTRGMLGWVADEDLLDVGVPAGYLEATAALGTAHPEWGSAYWQFLADMVQGRS